MREVEPGEPAVRPRDVLTSLRGARQREVERLRGELAAVAAERDWLRELLRQRDAELREALMAARREPPDDPADPADPGDEPLAGSVGALSDRDLADLFVVAREALLRVEGVHVEREAYWRAVLAATMREGAERPTFTTPDPVRGWRRLRRFLRREAAIIELRDALALDAPHERAA